jgi:arsenate reductase-like glutaredoxin family protein
MNARKKGHDYERKIKNEFKSLGYQNCETSRYASRILDDQKVDLFGTDPFNVQCKAVEKLGSVHNILKEMPDDKNYNLIFHKKNNQGEVVILTKEDFYKILTVLKDNNLI